MATSFTTYARLEPHPFERDYEAGFSAAIQDPVWFLGRQWQMGEHQGENASSPVWVDYTLNSRTIHAADARFHPDIIPAEAIVESELSDWWTLGRRIRIGKRFVNHPKVKKKKDLHFGKTPPPYEFFEGRPDGLAIWLKREALGIPKKRFGTELPPRDSIPAWSPSELLYQQTDTNAFKADQKKLQVNRHRGGRLDWYSVDAAAGPGTGDAAREKREAIPTALYYPGAPNSRWWQVENRDVDIGGYVPDSSHTPTAFLTELVFSHSDDWFLFPVPGQAGSVIAIERLEVTDAFGRTYTSDDLTAGTPRWPGLQAPNDWTLFKVDGLQPNELVLWHVAELPLESTPVERVQFGLDEESNLLWAVERVIDSRDAHLRKSEDQDPSIPVFNPGHPKGDTREGEEREYAYIPGQGIVPYWHPYVLEENGVRMLVQRTLPDFTRQKPVPMPAPQANVLQPEAGGAHRIRPLAVPSNGIEVERRWQLARDMHGTPVLWIQRQRKPLLEPPARRLRFDVLAEANFE